MIVRELITLLGFSVDGRGADQYDNRLKRVRKNAKNTGDAIERITENIKGKIAALAAAALAAGGFTAIVKAGDEMTNSLNRLEGSLGSAERAREIYEQLYGVVKVTGASMGETTSAFARYNLALEKNGRTAEDTVKLIGGLQAGMSALGLSTGEVSSVTLQLGQALGSGKLGGDELRSLREAMPQLVDSIRKALKLTDAEFQKASEKGELTSEKLIGPLLDYAEEAQKQLANLTPTVSRSVATLRNVWARFLADLDHQLGLSQMIARNLNRIRDWLDGLRSRLTAVGDFVRDLGGLDRILRVVAIAAGIATAAILAFNAALLVTIGEMAVAAAPFVAAGAAIVALALILDDFISWVQGNTEGSVFGRMFGDADKIFGPIRALFDGIRDAWNDAIARMKPQVEWLLYALNTLFVGAVKAVKAAWSGLADFFQAIWNRIVGIFTSAWDKIKPIVDAVVGAARSMEGTGTGSPPPGSPRRGGINGPDRYQGYYGAPLPGTQQDRDDLRGMLDFEGMGRDLAARGGGGAAVVNAPVTNTVRNEITVNATGSSGAEVAAGAKAGVGQAMDQTVPRLSREVGMAMPRAEAAAQ